MKALSCLLKVGAVTLALIVGACGSSSTPRRGGSTGDGGSGGAEEVPGDTPTGGGGPCTTQGQDACNACIDAASKKCSAGMCRQEDLDLENCSVAAVYFPCEDKFGNESIDCCDLQQWSLIQCWNRCPEMRVCT